MLKIWENPLLSIEDRLGAASGEIERVCVQRDAAADRIKELEIDCSVCSNNNKINGLSQESYCEQCKHAGWLQNHFSPITQTT